MSTGKVWLLLFATRQLNSPPVGLKLGLFENAPGIDQTCRAEVQGYSSKSRRVQFGDVQNDETPTEEQGGGGQ